MKQFYMNGYLWRVEFVDPRNEELVDRTGESRLATTDPALHYIFLSNRLNGDLLRTVMMHELGHVTMISYGLLDQIHTLTKPRYWIEAEEWVCNFLADYSPQIFEITRSLLG